MSARKVLRRLAAGVGLGLAMLLLIALATPLWWPWVLRPLARSDGVRYDRFERLGYQRFALFGVSVTNQTARFRAERLEALVPSVWLWRKALASRPAEHPFLTFSEWRLELLPSRQAANPSTYAEAQAWATRFHQLQKWLPAAQFSQGTIRNQRITVTCPEASWSNGVARAEFRLPSGAPVELTANLAKPSSPGLHVRSVPLHLDSTIALSLTPAMLAVQSASVWLSNRVELTAQFGRQGTLPEQATLTAPDFRLPSRLTQLPEYEDVTGSLSAKWRDGRFGLDLQAGANPVSGQTFLPPLTLALHARGNTNAAVVESARLSSPWIQAELSPDLRLAFTGPLLREPARLNISVDLARQPWFLLQGVLAGEASFRPTAGRLPAANFRLTGTNIRQGEVQAESLSLEGNLNWPWLEIAKVDARFEDGSTGSLAGKLDLHTRVVEDGSMTFAGPLARRWLPANLSFENLSVAANFHGPLGRPVHSGHMDLSHFTAPYLQPLHIRAGWRGESLDLERVTLNCLAGHSAISAESSARLRPTSLALVLHSLSLRTNSQPLLDLGEPCRITAGWARDMKAWSFANSPFNWSGVAGELHLEGAVSWPQAGALSASIKNLNSSVLADFTRTNIETLTLHHLAASVAWTNGPATYALDLSGTRNAGIEKLQPSRSQSPASEAAARLQAAPLRVELKLQGGAQGLVLSNLVTSSLNSTVVVAHGFLPLKLVPGATANMIQVEPRRALDLSATVQPDAFLWNLLSERTGIRLRSPNLRLALSGTWDEPLGKIQLDAQQVQLPGGLANAVALTGLQLELLLDRQHARLTNGQVFVQGQPVRLTADLPLTENLWSAWQSKQFTFWTNITAHLQIADAQLAAFQPLAPTLLSPQGQFDADLWVRPGLNLDGELFLQDARTRPLPDLGPLRNISVRLKFRNRTARLAEATARIGGAAVGITGEADLRGADWLKGSLPPLQFVLRGTNVPLARQPEFIVRSDLNLSITKTNGTPPLLAGSLHLRDSYYLSDLSPLAPGKVAAPSRRPPFFSIDDPLLADWRLAISATGEKFLKVRSPAFNGVVSANLKLEGTLKDPVSLGDVKIDSGTVLFPFANIHIDQGLVTLTSQAPYRPQLNVIGTAKQFGYDIKMEVTGTADKPIIQFTSTPPLSSEQILLMVSAGEMPREEPAFSTRQRAQALAIYLARDVLAKLGFSDQAQDRLTIRSGEEISLQGTPTYNIEYKLSRRWSITGEYDQFNDFNVGLKWRVYSK